VSDTQQPRATVTPTTAADVLADGVEGGEFQGMFVRKGSIAAFIANAKALAELEPGTPDYQVIADAIRDLKPALEALALFDVVEVRDPAVAAILAPA
jgi:hypothetical protein